MVGAAHMSGARAIRTAVTSSARHQEIVDSARRHGIELRVQELVADALHVPESVVEYGSDLYLLAKRGRPYGCASVQVNGGDRGAGFYAAAISAEVAGLVTEVEIEFSVDLSDLAEVEGAWTFADLVEELEHQLALNRGA